MTFEEMQRAMEFVVQQQAQTEVNLARLEASLSSEQQQRVHRDRQFGEWMSKIAELLVLQSSRMDSADKQHRQTLARLDRILEILASRT